MSTFDARWVPALQAATAETRPGEDWDAIFVTGLGLDPRERGVTGEIVKVLAREIVEGRWAWANR